MRKLRALLGAGMATVTVAASLLTGVPAASAATFIPWGEEIYLANAAKSAGVYIQIQQDGLAKEQRMYLRLKDLAADGYQPRVQVDWAWENASPFITTEGPWRNTRGNGSTVEFWTDVTQYHRYHGAVVWVWNGNGPRAGVLVPTR